MKEIVELMISEDDIYYFNLQKENFGFNPYSNGSSFFIISEQGHSIWDCLFQSLF